MRGLLKMKERKKGDVVYVRRSVIHSTSVLLELSVSDTENVPMIVDYNCALDHRRS
jgi:hypothetical protein